MAMTLVSTVTVGSGGAASIEFTNIPQTGKDLLVLTSLRTNYSDDFGDIYFQFNNQNTNTYSFRRLYGTGSSVASDSGSNINNIFLAGARVGSTATSNVFANSTTYISNYTSSASKVASSEGVSENNASNAFQVMTASAWSGTAAITSIKIFDFFAGNFVQHSTASLYIIS